MDIDGAPVTQSDLPSLAENRYFPQGKAATKTPTRYQGRSAKWRQRHDQCEVYRAGLWPEALRPPPEPRPYQRAALATLPRCDHAGRYGWTPRSAQRLERTWVSDVEEGRDLARSRARLPSDNTARGAALRPPSLERQEAFRDARTAKKSMSGLSEGTWPDEDDLYRMGLLYDGDEQARGSGFGFWAVERRAYSVNYRRREAKRGRKKGTDAGWAAGDLPLELSFAVLSDDEIIARYLLAPCEEEEEEEAPGVVEAGRAAGPAHYTLDSQPTIEESPDEEMDCARCITTSRSSSSGDTFSLVCEDETHGHDGSDDGDGDWAFLEQPHATFNANERGNGENESMESGARRSTRRRESWVVLG